MNTIKSFRTPVTLPKVVTNYYEPTENNGLSLKGGNRAAHQLFVSHQIRLMNTILGSLRGLHHKKSFEMATQNRMISPSDLLHLQNIADRLLLVELIDSITRARLVEELTLIFQALFPTTNLSTQLTNKSANT